MRNKLQILLLLVVFGVMAGPVWACTCIDLGDGPEGYYSRAENVAVFKLVSVAGQYRSGSPGAKLRVRQVFKGGLKRGAELTFEQGSGIDCLFVFSRLEIGKEYIFYLGPNALDHGMWSTMGCEGSKEMAQAEKDEIKTLKALKKRR